MSEHNSRKSILIVDDADDVCKVLAAMLRTLNYQVMTAGSAAQALEIAQRDDKTIDLLLTDMSMPDTDGPLLAEQIARRQPGIRTIFMSGGVMDMFASQKERIKDNFIQKPISKADLADKISDVLSCQ